MKRDGTAGRWLILALITAAGAAVRLAGLGQGLSPLEVNTLWYGRMPLADIFLASDYFPHIYALAHIGTALWGDSEAALRLPFALAGSLLIPVTFFIGRRLFSERAGLLAALLVAVSPFQIQHSQTARYYILLMLYAGLMLGLLLAAWDARGWRRALAWAGFAAAAVLNLHTHIFALYPLALSLASSALLAFSGRGSFRERWRRAWPMAAVLVVCAVSLLDTAARYRFFFLDQLSSGASLLQTASQRLNNPGNVFAQMLAEFSGGRAAGMLYAALAVAAAVGSWRSRAESLLHLSLWTILPLASLWVVRARHHFEPWYFSFLAPLWLIWAARGMDAAAGACRRLHPRAEHAALAALLGLALWTGGSVLAADCRTPRSAWREAVAGINARCSPGDAVFLQPQSGQDSVTRYYGLRAGCRLYDLSYLSDPSPQGTAALFARSRRIWLAAQDVPAAGQRAETGRIRALLDRAYERRGEWEHEDIRVSLYERRPGVAAALGIPSRGPAPASRASWKVRRSGPAAYLGNIFDAPEVALGFPESSRSLVRTFRLEPGRERAAPSEAGHAYVLSGSVQPLGGGALWRAGDVLVWGGGGSPTLLPAGPAGAALLWLTGLREPPVLARVGPGKTLRRRPATGRGLAVVLQGRVRRRATGIGAWGALTCYLLKGDVFTGRRGRRPSWIEWTDVGPDEAILLIGEAFAPR